MRQAGLPLSSAGSADARSQFAAYLQGRRQDVSESLPTPAAIRKAEREVAEFRKFQQLSREFVETSSENLPLAAAGG